MSTSSLTATSSGVFSGTQKANVGLVNGGSDSMVSVTGSSQITATGNVENRSHLDDDRDRDGRGEATGSTALDAALATSLVTNSAVAYLSGTTSMSAGGTVNIASADNVSATTNANGSAKGTSASGCDRGPGQG